MVTKKEKRKKVQVNKPIANRILKELEDHLGLIQKLTDLVKSQQAVIDKIRGRMGI